MNKIFHLHLVFKNSIINLFIGEYTLKKLCFNALQTVFTEHKHSSIQPVNGNQQAYDNKRHQFSIFMYIKN